MCAIDRSSIVTASSMKPPYFGSITKEKDSSRELLKLVNSAPHFKKVLNLPRLVGWCVPLDSQMASALESVLVNLLIYPLTISQMLMWNHLGLLLIDYKT